MRGATSAASFARLKLRIRHKEGRIGATSAKTLGPKVHSARPAGLH
jgi:hypothetical protein